MFNLPPLFLTEKNLRANNVTEGKYLTHSITNMTPRTMKTDAYQDMVALGTDKILSSSLIGAIFIITFLVYIVNI